jgi:hypothetical protein
MGSAVHEINPLPEDSTMKTIDLAARTTLLDLDLELDLAAQRGMCGGDAGIFAAIGIGLTYYLTAEGTVSVGSTALTGEPLSLTGFIRKGLIWLWDNGSTKPGAGSGSGPGSGYRPSRVTYDRTPWGFGPKY